MLHNTIMKTLHRRDFLRHTTAGLTAGILLNSEKLFADDRISQRPNIVFVLADQWRASAVGYAGNPDVQTPNIDRLAMESINFENAVSVCPVCTPYRASLMTGRYPTSTGMVLNDIYLPDDEFCMAEMFKSAGYQTAYIGKWHLDGHGRGSFIPPERRQGFEYWKAAECDHHYPHSHYYTGNAPEKLYWQGYDTFAQTEDARKYIRTHAGDEQPFLLFLSYGTPHFPHHTAPKEFRDLYPPDTITLRPNVPESMKENVRKEASGYYGHCTALDRCIGDLLNTLDESGIAENTLFVFTSDHGEMLGSHGVNAKEKQRPWDESIRVPFLLRYPAVQNRQGNKIETPVNTPDILPTILSLSGIAVPASVEGEDFSNLIMHPDRQRNRAALFMIVTPFAGYSGGKEFRGIRTANYTYVRSLDGPWLLYDNRADPYQLNNLTGNPDYTALQRKLDNQLQMQLKNIGDEFMTTEAYLQKWDYHVKTTGEIPYIGRCKVQSPGAMPEDVIFEYKSDDGTAFSP